MVLLKCLNDCWFQERFIKMVLVIEDKIKRAEFVGFGFFILFFLMIFFLMLIFIIVVNSHLKYAYLISNPAINKEFMMQTIAFLNSEPNKSALYLKQLTLDEALHMIEVRDLINRAFYYSTFGLTISLSTLVFLITLKKIKIETITNSYIKSLWLSLIILVLLIATFSTSFEIFHKIFFPKGNYLFPLNSILIRNLPESFFMKFFALSFVETVIAYFLIIKIIILSGKKTQNQPISTK